MAQSPNSPHCHDDDVIAFGDSIFKISKFREAVQNCFGHDVGYGLMALLESQGVKIDKNTISPDGDKSTFGDWFNEGIACELLKTDVVGWHRAKARIKIDIEIELEETPPIAPPVQPPDLDLEIDEQDATLHADMWSGEAAGKPRQGK
ncbi:MAG: hypothetical protein F6J87_19515 [Spirulina sp. SIO3F2]|nr:hypothetical protein [Spirulina sp. SIO3F2]